ncbi:MAG TPA: hypothetical protein VNO32_26975, partial [Candidatus Acidoferrum sp.]|nr:hypothetical protein [Candidatus Acidoferrum sp.]
VCRAALALADAKSHSGLNSLREIPCSFRNRESFSRNREFIRQSREFSGCDWFHGMIHPRYVSGT